MGFGPVDIVIINFPGNKFNGKVAPTILDLVESGTIRLFDLLFISKDGDGVASVLDSEDADELSKDLALNSSALIVAFENTWAAKFTDAISASNARVLDQIRIPAEVVTNYLESK